MAHGNTVLLSCFNIQVCCLYSALALLPHEQGSAINFHQSVCLSVCEYEKDWSETRVLAIAPFLGTSQLVSLSSPSVLSTNQPTHPPFHSSLPVLFPPPLCSRQQTG